MEEATRELSGGDKNILNLDQDSYTGVPIIKAQ